MTGSHGFQLGGGADWRQRWRQVFANARSWLASTPEARLCSGELENDLKTTTLGGTGLSVSRIAVGAGQLGGDWGHFDEDVAITAIRRARELGVNFFDTSA